LSFSDQLSREADAILGAVTTALSIVAAFFAIQVVNEIDKQQIASAQLMGATTEANRPPLPPFQFGAATPT